MATRHPAEDEPSQPPGERAEPGQVQRGRPLGEAGRRPPGDPLSAAIIDALRAFTTSMDRYIDVHGGAVGMHRTDLVALAHVMDAGRRGDHLTPTELSAALNLSPPATSALLSRLESVGHVRRTHASSDRRRVSVEMTDVAQGVGRRVFGPLAAEMAGAIEAYTPQERDLVLRFLTDVLAATARATEQRTAGPAPD
jgi:DNA-binding MarR family transcriptional regulator